MLILYKKDETNFNNLGVGILKDYISAPLITEVLNAEYTLEFDYAINGVLAEQLDVEMIIKDTSQNNQLFVVDNIKKLSADNKITVLAKHIAIALMGKAFLEDVAPTNQTSQGALEWIVERTQSECDLTVTGNCVGSNSARYVRKKLSDAVYNADNSILARFGGELSFDNKTVRVWQKRSHSKTYELREGKNVTGIEYNCDFSTVVTRVMPKGKDGLLIDEKYIDSPLIDNYVAPITDCIEFSDIGYEEEDGTVTKTEEQAKEELKAAVAKLYDGGLDKPTTSIKVDFVELTKCIEYKDYAFLEIVNLGDDVKAYVPFMNLVVNTRVIKTVWNCDLGRYESLELGTVTPTIATNAVQTENTINNVINNYDPTSILIQAQNNANVLMKQPFGGYIYFNDKAGEMYLMDTKDVATSQKFWKFGLGGIGYSNTGIDGDYNLAITNDGSIVADFITAGTMSANIIHGGILKLGTNLNESGKIEVYDESNTLVSTYDKDGLTIYNADGNKIVANKNEFGGYDANGDMTFKASKDKFVMNKAEVSTQIDIGSQVRFLYMKNNENEGVGIVSIV